MHVRAARRWVLPGVLLAVVLAGSVIAYVATRGDERSSDAADRTGATTQKSEGGNVTVEVTWNGIGAGPVFEVKLDTHSVDLDGIDLSTLALLRVGGREVAPASWEAPKGGHHRAGMLSFPATAADGMPLIGPESTIVELVMRDVAGVPERIFTWRP